MKITAIQRCSPHDGPGLRTVVFTKGCPLRCFWCHNPETRESKSELMFSESLCIGCGECAYVCKNGVHTFDSQGIHSIFRKKCIACGMCCNECPGGALELSAKNMKTDDIFREIMKDSVFYKRGGGLTVSGGEPLMQPQETMELLSLCKHSGVSTAIETCGEFDGSILPHLSEVCDYILFDWKVSDPELHRRCTGRSNENILRNLRLAASLNVKIILRCIIIRGINTCNSHYDTIASIASEIPQLLSIDLLPYHRYGAAKGIQLGLTDNTSEKLIPTAETLLYARERISARLPGVTVNIK